MQYKLYFWKPDNFFKEKLYDKFKNVIKNIRRQPPKVTMPEAILKDPILDEHYNWFMQDDVVATFTP